MHQALFLVTRFIRWFNSNLNLENIFLWNPKSQIKIWVIKAYQAFWITNINKKSLIYKLNHPTKRNLATHCHGSRRQNKHKEWSSMVIKASLCDLSLPPSLLSKNWNSSYCFQPFAFYSGWVSDIRLSESILA
jgi:hypothetical protein